MGTQSCRKPLKDQESGGSGSHKEPHGGNFGSIHALGLLIKVKILDNLPGRNRIVIDVVVQFGRHVVGSTTIFAKSNGLRL